MMNHTLQRRLGGMVVFLLALLLQAAPLGAKPFVVHIDDADAPAGGCRGWRLSPMGNSYFLAACAPAANAPACTITPPQTVSAGATATMAVSCTAPNGGTLLYQWLAIGSATAAVVSTAASFTSGPITEDTLYYVVVAANGVAANYTTSVTLAR
jgi:hypothetical protein